MLSFYKDLKIRYKISIIIITTLLISSLVTAFFSDTLLNHAVSSIVENELVNLTNQLVSMTETLAHITVKNRLKSFTNMSFNIMAHFYQMYFDGILTEKQALTESLLFTEATGPEGAGFTILIRTDGTILTHPLEEFRNHHISEYFSDLSFLNNTEGFFENTLRINKNQKMLIYSRLFEPWDICICSVVPKSKMYLLVNTKDVEDHISNIRFGKTGYPFILDNKGNILIHPIFRDKNIFDISPKRIWSSFNKIINNKSGNTTYRWQNPGESTEREKLVYFKHIPELNWIVCSSSYVDEYKSAVNRLRLLTGLIYLVTLLIIIPIILKVTDSITIPLIKIINSIKKGAKGNYTTRVHVSYHDEIGNLADYYNTFMDHLEKEIEDRLEAEKKLKKLYENLEERIKQRTLELEIANTELENFSSTVSHDLKSPLGIINGMTQILNENLSKTETDPENLKITKKIINTTNQMEKLINELLHFSRIDNYELNIERFNASEIIRSIADNLTSLNKKRDVEFIIEDDIFMEADKTLLISVLENLISNAYKFSERKEMAVIEFGVMEEHKKAIPGRPIYYVRDNGAGFDMKDYKKLFSAFQRLHSQDDFKGTGVGLANVYKIISRHNGRIWAESKPGYGATLYFQI